MLEGKCPPETIYRIARKPDPWQPPDSSRANPDKTFGNRFDDPEGYYRVIYAASQKLSYFLETLARFRADHSGGYLREALLEALQYGADWWLHVDVDFFQGRHRRRWEHLSARRRARWLLGQLWHCTDIVPADERANFDGENVVTYARLVRVLASHLKPDVVPPGHNATVAGGRKARMTNLALEPQVPKSDGEA